MTTKLKKCQKESVEELGWCQAGEERDEGRLIMSLRLAASDEPKEKRWDEMSSWVKSETKEEMS